jgi:hypothetical protein
LANWRLEIVIELILNNIKKAQNEHSFSKLEKLVPDLLNTTPITTLDIQKGVPIERVRNNYNGEYFFSEDELSYRKDKWNIKEFGRANIPFSSKFYGSLKSEYIHETRVVNVLETNKIFRQNRSIRKRQIFTSGQWVTNDTLKVAVFSHNPLAIVNNEEIKKHVLQLDNVIFNLSSTERAICKKVIKFLSYYYGKPNIYTHLDYCTSALVSEHAFDKYKLDGILYPSVRSKYKAYNVVLNPLIADTKLFFNNAAMFELMINRNNVVIDNLASGRILNNNRIEWDYLERTSDKVLNHFL